MLVVTHVCERMWVMATAELGRTAGLPHLAERGVEEISSPHPPCWRGGGGDKGLFPNATAEA